MPNWSSTPIPTLLQDARRLYTNAKGDAEIAAALALFKVPVATLDEGLALIATIDQTTADLGGETLDASEATTEVRQARAGVEDDYATDREMARTVYGRDSDGYQALGLRGRIPDARAAVLSAAKGFYGTLESRPGLIDPIPGLTPEIVTARLAAVEAAETADSDQADEEGDVDVVSRERTEAIAALRAHASKTARIAKKALKDRPQLREKLGLLERS